MKSCVGLAGGQETTVAATTALDEPTACALSPDGAILVVGTNAGGPKGVLHMIVAVVVCVLSFDGSKRC